MAQAVGNTGRPHPGPPPEGEGASAPHPGTPAAELQYAPRPPLRRRRVVGRVVVGLAVLAFAAAAVYGFPVWQERVTLYVLQRQCMRHAPAADEVVFDSGPGRAEALMALGGYHHMAGPPAAAFLVPPYWRDFYAKLSPPGLRSHGTVFLGRMTTRGGKQYLVAVDMSLQSAGTDDVLLMSRVVEPGSLLRRPRMRGGMGVRLLSFGLLDAAVTPGQVDPADPTHLILFGGRVHGWLADDGSMNLRPHDPGPVFVPNDGPQSRPATRPAPSSPASPRSSAGPATRPSAAPASR